MNATPAPVAATVRQWLEAGMPAQAGIAWGRDRWLKMFPEHQEVFEALPDSLDRRAVASRRSEASESPEGAERFFVAVMAWGMGSNGYGPWRTKRVLTSTPNAQRHLHHIATTMADEGALAAYAMAGGNCRLKYLGPAFGTKYLHFLCDPDAKHAALIFDALLAAWLANNIGMSLNPLPWSSKTYGAYLQHMTDWADDLDVTMTQLESCIFRAEANSREGNQWADPN